MRVSVIVSNFNGARFLPKLLESLKGQRGVETEIIVVDRQSRDESAQILASWPEVKVVSEPPETGLVAGYHAGTSSATTDLFFFCNEDMWFDADCLQKLASQINLASRVGAADGWHWTYDGETWLHGGTRFAATPWAINSPFPRRTANFQVPSREGDLTPFPCAGAFLIHRDVYREIGGWDGSFFLDHEDIDLFIRAWQRRWCCVSVPEARIYHALNASNNQTLASLNLKVSERRYVSQRSSLAIVALKYFRWRGLFWALGVWPTAFLNNIFRGRWDFVRRDLAVLLEIRRRLPAALAFRSANGPYNKRSPGERFFIEPGFSA